MKDDILEQELRSNEEHPASFLGSKGLSTNNNERGTTGGASGADRNQTSRFYSNRNDNEGSHH